MRVHSASKTVGYGLYIGFEVGVHEEFQKILAGVLQQAYAQELTDIYP